MTELHVLVVDDEPAIRQVMSSALTKAGYPVDSAGSAAEALAKLERTPYDVVLSDIFMPITDGIELVKQARARGHAATFIMITAFASVDSAIEALKAGAWDYITKPVHNEEILRRLEQIDALRGLREENRTLRRMVMGGDEAAFRFTSPSMQAVERLVTRVAPTDSTVLITGESGTGKGVAARRLHELSLRRDGPFVSVNCGAIPENLIESELFGHTKGAFTSADRARKGMFLQADHGTIFLDEIGELPLALQTKLLRTLQEGTVLRLGGKREKKVDVRLVAATHRDLQHEVTTGAFRSDLFYRLYVIPIRLPSLRERRDDIPLLALHFLNRANQAHQRNVNLTPEALARLVHHPWPGNIRELGNVIERLVLLADAPVVGPQVVERLLHAAPVPAQALPAASTVATGAGAGLGVRDYGRVDSHPAELLREALARHGGNRSRAAQALGLTLRQFSYRCKKLGLTSE